MGRSVIKIPCFVLPSLPPLSYERGGNPLRNHHDFLGRFLREGNGVAAEGYKKANKYEI